MAVTRGPFVRTLKSQNLTYEQQQLHQRANYIKIKYTFKTNYKQL